METSESEYPVPPDQHFEYEDSWRPEDKAIESAEREAAAEHPRRADGADDAVKVDPAFKDRDS